MPIPHFDAATGCLPATPRLHDATIDEMYDRYVVSVPTSANRPIIHEAYLAHVMAWTPIIGQEPREQWVNGSFVTDKIEPHDVDLITLVPNQVLNLLGPEDDKVLEEELFKGNQTPEGELVHAFLLPCYPDGHPLKWYEQEMREYWLEEAFGLIQETGVPKGMLRVQAGGLQ